MSIKNILYIVTIQFLLITNLSAQYLNDTLILCNDKKCDTLFIGISTPNQVIEKFGKQKIQEKSTKFSGNTQEQLYGKEAIIDYKELGLSFTFDTQGYYYKDYAKKNEVFLRLLVIKKTSKYNILNKFSIGMKKEKLDSLLGQEKVLAPIKYLPDDSISIWYYSPSGMYLLFTEKNGQKILDEIWAEITETTSLFNIQIADLIRNNKEANSPIFKAKKVGE